MDQLKNKTQSEVAWINTFQLFVTFFLVSIDFMTIVLSFSYRSPERIYWTGFRLCGAQSSTCFRHSSDGIRPHDDLFVQGVLPVLPRTRPRPRSWISSGIWVAWILRWRVSENSLISLIGPLWLALRTGTSGNVLR